MPLSIKALRYFLIAADNASIARAAEQLNVVPSAISSAIESVEEEFQLKLLQRYPAKGVRPTTSGKAMMQKIRHIIEEYDNLLLEGAELRTALSGQISMGYYAPVAPAFMPAIVKPLVCDNPQLRLKFTECDNIQAQSGLLDCEFDLIIFVAEKVRAGIQYETLLDAPAYLLVATDHPLARNNSVTFDDINGQNVVLLDLPFISEYYRNLIDENNLDVKEVATASNTEMLRSLVGSGIGCAILNMCPNSAVSYAGDPLTALPISCPTKSLKLVLGYLGGNQRRVVQVVAEECRRYFNSQQAQKLVITC